MEFVSLKQRIGGHASNESKKPSLSAPLHQNKCLCCDYQFPKVITKVQRILYLLCNVIKKISEIHTQ